MIEKKSMEGMGVADQERQNRVKARIQASLRAKLEKVQQEMNDMKKNPPSSARGVLKTNRDTRR